MTKTKNRFYKARKRAMQILEWSGYRVIAQYDGIFDIEATRELELRKIKICIDPISKTDMDQLKKIVLPQVCKKEIWIKKINSPDFEIIEIKNHVKS